MYVVHQGQIYKYKYKDKDKDNLSYSLILYPSLLFPLYFLKMILYEREFLNMKKKFYEPVLFSQNDP